MHRDDLLRLTLEQVDDPALILLDREGRVVAWLMGAEKIFGRSAQEMIGATIEALFTEEDRLRQVPESEIQTAARIGRAADDRWMLRKDGIRFWASGFVHRLCDSSGEIVGFAKLLRDRTDLRGQMDRMRSRITQLVAEDRRKVLMLGTLAHELRNPLGVLENAVRLIEMTHSDDESLSYAVQLLRRQTSYVSTLIEDLLELTRARTGKTVLQTTPLELGRLLHESIEAVSLLRTKEQRVEVSLPSIGIEIEGDRTRLKQVFVNLLANAAKFSPHGESVTVRGLIEDDEAVVRVEDRGTGIPPSMLPHVFDLLRQAEGVEGDGLGLGLAIVKEYVELHGGSVQVRSEGVGRGSEFTVRLPLKTPRDG